MEKLSPESVPILIRPKHKTLTDETVTAIYDAVQQGKFPAGSQLPPEIELMSSLRISRTTVREALRTLEEQGVIYRRRGLGTYVSEKPIEKDLSFNFGITEMISQAGFTPGSTQEEIRYEKAAGRVAERLEVEEGTPIVILDRVRTANDIPVVWSLDMVPAVLINNEQPTVAEFEAQSFYEFIEKNHKIRIYQGMAKIRPMLATKEIASKLQIRFHDLLLLITQVDYSADHRPVIYSIEYHLPDKFSFVINRKGPHR
jgi:GntR family transcriptional regulator